MSNFDTAVEATATALDSAGSAAEENARYMESLEAKMSQLKSTFQDFSNAVLDSELIKVLLELAEKILTTLNTEAGVTITQWGLLTGALTGGTVIFGTIASKLIGMIGTIAQVVTGVTTLTASFGTLASVAFPIAGLIAGIAVVGYNIYKEWKRANPTLEEATQKVQGLETELQTNQERLEEINAIPWYDRTEEMKAEKEELEKLNAELEENLELARQQRVDAAKDEVENKRITTEQVFQIIPKADTEAFAWVGNLPVEEFSNLKDLIQYVAELTDNNKLMEMSTVDAVKAIKDLGFEFNNFSRIVKTDAVTSNEEFIGTLNSMLNYLENAQRLGVSGESIDEQIRAYNKENIAIKSIVDAYKLLQEQGEVLDDSALELIETYDEWVETSGEAIDALAEQDRVNNIVTNGIKVSAEEMAKLARTYPELAENMATANGEAYILTDTLFELAASGDEVALSMAKAAQAMLRLEMTDALSKRNEAFRNYLDADNANAENVSELRDIYEQSVSEHVQATTDYYDLLAAIAEGNQTLIGLDDIIDGGGSSASKAAEDILQPLKDYLEKEEHKVFLLDKNDQEGNAQAIIDIYKNAQNVIHAYADKLRGLGYAEDSAEIRELQELWWEYQDNIEQVYENIRQIAEEKAAEAEKAWSEALQDNIESLQEQQSAYESLFNHMVSNIEEEIAALEEQKNAEEQYWDDKINALEEQNDELDRQLDLEKKMDALAKARQKKVMVYKDGRFQYIEDIDEVSAAQEELDEYNREEALRQEIENLEKLKEEAISNIDDQIEAWEEYKEAWSSIVDDYQKEQDRLLIEQQLGIDIENDNWKERLDNFKSFADEYINAMKELQAAQNEYNQGYQGPTADDYYDDIISSMEPEDNWEYLDSIIRGQSATLPNGRIVRVSIVDGHTQTKGLPVGSVVHTNGGDWQVTAVNSDGSYQSQKVNGYASGTLSASGGMSLVGENGPELRVVNSGDGIIPAEITKNLWAWGNFSPGNLIGGLINTLSTMKENSGIIIQNFNPNLPNVTDGESFVAYLQNNFIGDVMQIVHV